MEGYENSRSPRDTLVSADTRFHRAIESHGDEEHLARHFGATPEGGCFLKAKNEVEKLACRLSENSRRIAHDISFKTRIGVVDVDGSLTSFLLTGLVQPSFLSPYTLDPPEQRKVNSS